MSVYVDIGYADGSYYMIKIPEKNLVRWHQEHPNAIISDEKWAEYEKFLEEDRKWHKFIADLENQWYKKHGINLED